MVKVILFGFFFCLLPYFLVAQRIVVKDNNTLEGISGVSFFGPKSQTILFSNGKGEVNIQKLQGEDSVVVSSVGYKQQVYSYQRLTTLTTPLFLSEKIYAEDEIIVSSTKIESSREETPQQTALLTAKEMRFMNQQTTADVLQSSGHVLVQKSQAGGGSPIIRGFEANKVLMVIDGVRMNNAIYRSGHLQNILTIDNTVLDKVELVFGPGSALYGSDALGGVMHFYTKKPILSDSSRRTLVLGNSFLRYGTSNNEKSGHIDLSTGFKKIGFLTSVTFSEFGDLRQGENRRKAYKDFGKDSIYVARVEGKDSIYQNGDGNIQLGTGYTQYDIMQKILYQRRNTTTHLLNFQFSNSSNINRYDRLSETTGGVPKFAEWYYGPQKRILGSYTLTLNRKTKLFDQAAAIVAYQDIEESRHDRRYKNSIISHRIENVQVYSANLDLSKKIKKHKICYGGEAVYNNVTSTATRENSVTGTVSPQNTRYPDGGSYMSSFAIYATHTIKLDSKWILIESLRYSKIGLGAKFNDTSFFVFPYKEVRQNNNAITGNIGLVYLPGRDWKLAILGATGFRAPNVDDMSKVYESVGGSIILPNSELRPEYSYTGELNLSKQFYSNIKVETTGYYTWLKDVISVGKSTYQGADSILFEGLMSEVKTSLNNREAYVCGYSIGLVGEVNSYISFRQTLNYTYGRIKTDSIDSPLDHIAPLYGRTSAMYKRKKIRAETFLLYNGWKRLNDYAFNGEDNLQYATSNGMPSWCTINFRMAYQINEYLFLQLAIENIADINYRVFASGVTASGRTIFVKIGVTF